MKRIFISIFIICSSCSTTSELNREILVKHQNSLSTSPFTSAETAKSYVKAQKRLRQTYIDILDSVISSKPGDTIYLIESHDHICINCPADLVQIWAKEHYIKMKINDSTYNSYDISTLKVEDIKYYSTSSLYRDIRELKREMQKGICWWKKPTDYGTERCSDGSHSFYTVFFNGRIESMYMRCYQ